MTIIQFATNQRHTSFNHNLTNHNRMIWTSDTEYSFELQRTDSNSYAEYTYFKHMTELRKQLDTL
jgi:hypothetical protein